MGGLRCRNQLPLFDEARNAGKRSDFIGISEYRRGVPPFAIATEAPFRRSSIGNSSLSVKLGETVPHDTAAQATDLDEPMTSIDLNSPYMLHPDCLDAIESPGLLVFHAMLEFNLNEMLRIAGSADRLRPHCKTHKIKQIVQRQLELGITRHKCATLREAEMLAEAGVADILIAYQLVGPNIAKLARLIDRFPQAKFATLVDHPQALRVLSDSMEQSGKCVGAFMDVDSGMHRTGIQPDESGIELYEMICTSPGIEPRGLHWYDGHHRESDLALRTGQVDAAWQPFERLRNQLLLQGLPIPSVVAAGTGSFPVLAERAEPGLELSPGTVTYFDTGYQKVFPDLGFQPALGILTRVVSCNRSGFLTLDVGHKSCAADPPAGSRLAFPDLPDAREITHTEEHLVIATDRAKDYEIGDSLVALPTHVCPTSALHDMAHVIQDGRPIDQWPIAARGRQLRA